MDAEQGFSTPQPGGTAAGRPQTVSAGLARAIRDWLPQSAVEWVWWPIFAFWAFFPSSRTPVLDIKGLELTLKDALLACTALLTLPWMVLHRNRLRHPFLWTFLPFTALTAYAILTALVVGNYRGLHLAYIIFPAVQAWFAMCLAFTVVSSLPHAKIRGFGQRSAVALLIVTVAYGYVTLFPGTQFRQFERVPSDFGVPRLAGPLGLSTLLPAILLPAISYLLLGIKGVRMGILRALGVGTLAAGIFLGGSRAGVVALASFILILTAKRGGLKRVIATVPLVVLAAVLVFRIAVPTRLMDFSERYRTETYISGLAAWTQNAATLIFGQGYGEMWPWYRDEIWLFKNAARESRWLHFERTPFGRMLAIPASTILLILVETGVVGSFLFGLALGSQLLPALRRPANYSGVAPLLAPGLAASLVIFFFDAVLVKAFPLGAIWWAFFFVMAADLSVQKHEVVKAKPHRRAPFRAPVPSEALAVNHRAGLR